LRNLGLNQVIKDLWSIGYACEWHIISARSIGACHLRERIWIIAYPDSTNLRKQSRGRGGKERENKALPRDISEDGGASNSNSQRLEGQRESLGISEKLSTSDNNAIIPSNSDMPRLWKPFVSEKDSSGWWAEATAGFRDWWKVESAICRVDDGLPRGLDKGRKERVKQLGNTVLPQIPELIGRAIMEYEKRNL
jgi:DNA (cytosine-5)-methyltransferase 1